MAIPQNVHDLDLTIAELGRFGAWLAEQMKRPVTIESARLVSGGRSNLTYAVMTDAGRFALRRPPHGSVSPTAHDVAREHLIMAALSSSNVPVPAMIGLCEENEILGAPFYVAEFVTGTVLRSAEEAARLPLDVRAAIPGHLVDTLVAIHSVDVLAQGLSSLARRGSYVERQVRRWRKQHDLVAKPFESIANVHRLLAEDMPEGTTPALVHGDYRLDNVVVDDAGAVTAVLDWELATIGDPVSDVAGLYVTWSGPAADVLNVAGGPTTAEGFGGPDDVVAQYERVHGKRLEHFEYYVAFVYWRLACILEGIIDRYDRGSVAGNRSSIDAYPEFIESFTVLSKRWLDKGGR